MNPLFSIFIAMLVAIVGALPLGLVNLSVLDVSYRKGKHEAMKIAFGASIIEIVFVLIAVFAGHTIEEITENVSGINLSIALIPFLLGAFFFFKKNQARSKTSAPINNYLKGLLLNLISAQVLLYWIIAMTYIYSTLELDICLENLLVFILGAWMGKMGVLWVYAYFSRAILSKSKYLANNINKFIGMVLILSSVFQIFKGL